MQNMTTVIKVLKNQYILYLDVIMSIEYGKTYDVTYQISLNFGNMSHFEIFCRIQNVVQSRSYLEESIKHS